MIRYDNVYIDAIAYELPPVVVGSDELERRVAPLYEALHFPRGQLEAMTGIYERRWWEPGQSLALAAAAAAGKALAAAGIDAAKLGSLLYAGVNRELFEPATACRVAHEIGVAPTAAVYDVSNACLGVLNGMLEVANRIALGQLRAGLVCSCETAREIVEITIDRMCRAAEGAPGEEAMRVFTQGMATLTGGSGAVAVLLTDGSFPEPPGGRHRLEGGALRNAPEHHELCRWGVVAEGGSNPAAARQFMETDGVAVLRNGVALGRDTWQDFLETMQWQPGDVDRVICHQVGKRHQEEILQKIGIPLDKDFPTYPYLGNVGTVSLPLSAALAAERGALRAGDRAALLGIGSGLNCMMLGVRW